MKNTIRIALIFVLVLAVLLAASYVIQHAAGPREPRAEDDGKKAPTLNEMNESGAAVITLAGDTASVTGLGAQAAGGVVTIKYPGTYRVEGTLDDGRLIVDLGEYTGAAYILLNGASISSSTGPALQVIQADQTTVKLMDGTYNTLSDGADYTVQAGGVDHPGAALYSADDLVIEGGGSLTLLGNAADGIRVKDELTVTGGSLNISSLDDGIQVNDRLTVTGGSMLIGCNGDGLNVDLGDLALEGGRLWIYSAADAVSAAGSITVSDGFLSATACGGSAMYSYIAMNDLSAKGLKAAGSITVTGGTLDLDCADDAIHAGGDVSITGGTLSLVTGDDAVHADGLLEIRNVSADISACYEALEGRGVRLGNIWLRLASQNNGIDAGEDGFVLEDGYLDITAPRAVGSEGAITIGGILTAVSDLSKTPLSFLTAEVPGGLRIYGSADSVQTVLDSGEVPASLLFVLPDEVPAGTDAVLTDALGNALNTTQTTADGGVLLYAGSLIVPGQSYTLTAGDVTYTAVAAEGCVVTPESAIPAENASGEPSGQPS